VVDSPVLTESGGTHATAQGLYRSVLPLGLRVLGENPFIIAMLVTPIPENVWAAHMYWWAVAILAWSLLTTFGGPLRILGPGFHYMKTSIFPTAYVLSVSVNIQEGAFSTVGLALLISLIASFSALAYFYRIMARRQTEHTAQTPPDLAKATEYLRGLAGQRVLVLPSMYADFVAYDSGKAVVWGGHSGDLRRFEEFSPVIRKPIDYFFRQYNVDYVVLDYTYSTPAQLRIEDGVTLLEQFGSIAVHEVLVRPEFTREPSLGLTAR